MTRRLLTCLTLLAVALPLPARATLTCSPTGSVSAVADDSGVVLSNGCVTRRWAPDLIRTEQITDERTGKTYGAGFDFRLTLDGVSVASDSLPIAEISTALGSVTWRAVLPGVLELRRTVTLYPGIAGFKADTVIESLAPLALSGYTLDEVSVGFAQPTIHEFRAGADWRAEDWAPQGSIGDSHVGDWREAHTNPPGHALTATGEWTSAAIANEDGSLTGESVAIVNERRDYASSIGTYSGHVVSAGVDLSRDIVYLGPFEEDAHIENPGPGPARHRLVQPGRPLALETAFTIIARDADDEGWQWWKYLTGHRLAPFKKRIMFNSDQVDSDARSTGAKDDMDYERFLQILPAVREMGADTFIFDDGWMARAGDWCPDSPMCTEPRYDGTPTSKFRPRFPDDTFAAVREQLAGDPEDPSDDIDLGLWMNPMAYHPSSKAFQTNPQWSCAPVGTGTGVVTAADPDSGSNEAGIGLWNPRAMGVHPDDPTRPIRMIDYLEERIVRAIEGYGAKIFKFDFLVWVDCGGAEPVTMYEYRDEFADMLDRIHAVHPEVTFQIDDTNDYRMWPFETVARGTSWFLNGGPNLHQTLHTVWSLAPFIPGSTLGMRSLNSGIRNGTKPGQGVGVDNAMAAAITTHLTFSFPVDVDLTSAERAQTKKWTDFYKANRDLLAGFNYPLLADPIELGWTALQPWDRDSQTGWLLAYRQGASTDAETIPLRGIDGASYHVVKVDPATGTEQDLGTITGDTLRAGFTAQIDAVNGYAFYRIERA